MADEKLLAQAKTVYETMCQAFDKANIKYDRDDEKLSVDVASGSDDLTVKMSLYVDADREVVKLLSLIPVNVPEDKRLDVALAATYAANKITNGFFDFEINKGYVFFRMTNSYKGCTVGPELFEYMLFVSYQTIDRYNDKFFMLAKGMITLEKFIEAVDK